MNIGELKLQNALFNSQLQLNNDLLNSKSGSISTFDNILKSRTENKSIGSRDSFVCKGRNQKKTQKNTGDRFDIKNRADFSKSTNRQTKGLSRQINEEIAKNKFSNSDINQNKKLKNGISGKIKALESKSKISLKDDDIENEIISEIAAMLGVSEKVLMELLGGSGEIDITQLAKSLMDSPELLNLISTKVNMLTENLEKKELVEFINTLEEVIAEIPKSKLGELIKSELSKIVDDGYEKVKFIVENDSKNESIVAMVSNEVKPIETSEKKSAFISSEPVELEEKVDKVKVESKDSKSEREFSGNTNKDVKSMVKLNSKATDLGKGNFEDQVNIMKDQNTLITSAKNIVQPKTVLARNITNQIVEGLKMSVKLSDTSSEILIKLNPKNLGNVALKMSFEKGVLIAQILVENQTVKGLVESNLTDLKNALKDEGYLIGDLDVSLNKDNSEKHNQSRFSNSSQKFSDESFEEFEEKNVKKNLNVVNNSEVNYLT